MESVNTDLNPLHRLILSYANPENREKYRFLFAFDSRLAEVIRSTSEPLIGQMRLTWWRDILTKTAPDRPEGEPLVSFYNQLEDKGTINTPLLKMIDGWEVLLEDFPWEDRQFDIYAQNRGTGYFEFVLDEPDLSGEKAELAKLWALWDFAIHCSDADMQGRAIQCCKNLMIDQEPPHFDRNGRPLSILCKLAMRDVKKQQLTDTIYRPSTALQIIWHGMTGL